jgi:signal peptidase II
MGLGVSGAVFVFDRLTKQAVMQGWVAQGPVLSTWVHITAHRNYGLMANLPLPGFLIIILSLLALAVLAYGLYDAGKQARIFDVLTLSLVLGGALANLYDRVAFGFVFDWLMFFQTSIVNAADAAIAIGLILYAVANYLRGRRKASVDCHVVPTDDIGMR